MFITPFAKSASNKTIKALENCSNEKWNSKNQSYRKTFEEKSLFYKKSIQTAKNDGYDNIVEFMSERLESHTHAGKKAYNTLRDWESNFTKQKLKKKLSENIDYEKYFAKCENDREKAPITFDAKWG